MQSRVYEYPNATVRVHFPDIADSENERRLQQIKRSAERLLREVIKAEETKLTKERNTANDAERTDPKVH